MPDAIVEAHGLGKRFRMRPAQASALGALRTLVAGRRHDRTSFDRWALRDVSFRIEPGERVAIVGRNGSGKTTLLRLLARIYRSTTGSLVIRSEPHVLFRSGIGLTPELSVTDNVFLFGAIHGVERSRLAQRLDEILEFAELGELAAVPLKRLSVGQVRRLALATFLQSRAGFLIFDEALDNVDGGYRRQVEERFRQLSTAGATLIMTSHRLELPSKLCDRALWIDSGRLQMDGPVESVLPRYSETLDHPVPAP